jgi:hypothetical protein
MGPTVQIFHLCLWAMTGIFTSAPIWHHGIDSSPLLQSRDSSSPSQSSFFQASTKRGPAHGRNLELPLPVMTQELRLAGFRPPWPWPSAAAAVHGHSFGARGVLLSSTFSLFFLVLLPFSAEEATSPARDYLACRAASGRFGSDNRA